MSHYHNFALLQNGKDGYEKWRVENSWGDDRGNKGNALKKNTLAAPLAVCDQRSDPAVGVHVSFTPHNAETLSQTQFPVCPLN